MNMMLFWVIRFGFICGEDEVKIIQCSNVLLFVYGARATNQITNRLYFLHTLCKQQCSLEIRQGAISTSK